MDGFIVCDIKISGREALVGSLGGDCRFEFSKYFFVYYTRNIYQDVGILVAIRIRNRSIHNKYYVFANVSTICFLLVE